MTHVVKQNKALRYEDFSRAKLIKSIIGACLSVRTSEGAAEITASAVCDTVELWLKQRPEVTSEDIRRVAAQTLEIHNPDAAYYYAQHKHIV